MFRRVYFSHTDRPQRKIQRQMAAFASVVLASAPPSNATSFTRIRLVEPALDAHGARRRLRLRDGWRLRGDLHTLGYFAADVCLGSPPRTFELIVDTGSSLMALPCAGCIHCGHHNRGTRFDPAGSSTSKTFSCNAAPAGMHCHSCVDGGSCGYMVSYQEGSRISGRMVQDIVQFASEQGRAAHPVAFGCQTYESGLFNSQVADGIVGFGYGGGYGRTLHDTLMAATSSPNTFSLCLSDTVGTLVMGGTLPPGGAASELQWVSFQSHSSYTVSVADFLIDGRSLGAPAHAYSGTIVDSGTTFTYLPPQAYNTARDKWRGSCPWAGGCHARETKGPYPDDYCYAMERSELSGFAAYAFRFSSGALLELPPAQYAYELRAGVWCLGIYNNERSGAVIGAATMRNHEVIFDKARARLAFVRRDCGSMHAGTMGSLLQGGYGISGCAAPLMPGSPPGPPSSPPPVPSTPPPPSAPLPPFPPPSPPKQPPPPGAPPPPSHPPGWSTLPPPSPSPPYVFPPLAWWSSVRGAVAAVISRIHDYLTGVQGQQARVVFIALGAAGVALCCALALIYYAVSELLADDHHHEVLLPASRISSDELAAGLELMSKQMTASLQTDGEAVTQEGGRGGGGIEGVTGDSASHIVPTCGGGQASKPGASQRVRWLPGLRGRRAARGYGQVRTEELPAATHFDVDVGGDEDDREPASG